MHTLRSIAASHPCESATPQAGAPRARALTAGLSAVLLLASCGGGGADPYTPGTDLPATDVDAQRFLQRATYGPESVSLARLQHLGYHTWIQEQREMRPSLEEPELANLEANNVSLDQSRRQESWWRHAIVGQDQLRQRVAFALSQIFVVSDRNDTLNTDVRGLASYYDMLSQNAFGTYRSLLEQVTLHPMMATYLSFLRNRKPDPTRNIRPDENYAREVMQLFSIGLVELNPDGSSQLDGLGQEIPTYTQADIEGLAHVFTGWNYAGATSWSSASPNHLPLEPNEAFHDQTQKTILDNTVFPAGRDARTELDAALDHLANHQNVGPFIGKQLIQRLVTSNPSPAYVARISAVWANDGMGVRGNLAAVIEAILLDDEAMHGQSTMPSSFGKLREGVLMQTALWRLLNARAPNGQFNYSNPETAFGEAALRADSVFNFFRPDYQPQGEMTTSDLNGPEFQILDQNTVIGGNNQLYRCVMTNFVGKTNPAATDVLVDLRALTTMAADPEQLIAWLDRWLLASAMPDALKQILRDHMAALTDMRVRASECLWLVVTSPQFAVQK